MTNKELLNMIEKRMNQKNYELENNMEENYELMCIQSTADNEELLMDELMITIKDEEHLLGWLIRYLDLYLVNMRRKEIIKKQVEKESN